MRHLRQETRHLSHIYRQSIDEQPAQISPPTQDKNNFSTQIKEIGQ